MDIVKKRLKVEKNINKELTEVKKILESSEPDDIKLDSIKAIFSDLAKQIVQAQLSSLYDERTGFLSAASGQEFLEREIEFAERYDREFSVAMIDIDLLKSINDKYGHVAGTKIITEIAAVIKKVLRKSDVVSRYGGDEFLVIFTNLEMEKAKIALGRIKKGVLKILVDGQVRASVSVGVASYQKSKKQTALDLIKSADKELYKDKKRNRKNITY